MITNDYSQELAISDELVLPKRGYHSPYVKESKVKNVLFALFIVVLLIAASIFLHTLT